MKSNKKITLLAPTSTWVAYNAWGGKSLYDNIIDSSNVYFVSTNRPNTLLVGGKHDINVEANIFNWFEKEYDINIYPDNILDQYPNILDDSEIIILSYHCEYISAKTYNKLKELIEEDGKSLISIGGNQIYWKIVKNVFRLVYNLMNVMMNLRSSFATLSLIECYI